LTHAIAALTAAADAERPVILLSAPNAGLTAGTGWFGALIGAARAAVPATRSKAILDCGDDAGAGQAAIRAGIESIVFAGRADIAARLADIARQQGARLLTERPAALLNLRQAFFAAPDTLRQYCAAALRDSKPNPTYAAYQ
jgi:hypothetical protein